MTEYQPTAEDRKAEQAIAEIDASLEALYTARKVLADAGLDTTDAYRASERDRERLDNARTRLVREGEARIAAFYGDRAKVKRAFKALRKAGFACSMTEPGYESTASGSFAIAEAQDNGGRFAFVRRPHVEHAFAIEPRWADRMTKASDADALTHDLHVYWGPSDGNTQEVHEVGEAIRQAFMAEGLRVEWSGEGSDTVTVKATKRDDA
jgi:hypothetical protein